MTVCGSQSKLFLIIDEINEIKQTNMRKGEVAAPIISFTLTNACNAG